MVTTLETLILFYLDLIRLHMANTVWAFLALQSGQNWTAALDHLKHCQSLKKRIKYHEKISSLIDQL